MIIKKIKLIFNMIKRIGFLKEKIVFWFLFGFFFFLIDINVFYSVVFFVLSFDVVLEVRRLSFVGFFFLKIDMKMIILLNFF